MALIQIHAEDLSKFWKETPTPLKYILSLVVVLVICYFTFSNKIFNNQYKEMRQTQQNITASYILLSKLDEFQRNQSVYNVTTNRNIQNLYSLILELSDNMNSKLNILINSNVKNKNEINSNLKLLNDSYSKLLKAYEIKDVNEKSYNIGVKPK